MSDIVLSHFLRLTSAGLTSSPISIGADASADDWKKAFELIFRHGLSAIVRDGLGAVECQGLTDTKVDLFLEAERIENENRRRLDVLRRFAALCAECDTKVLVLKGASLMDCYLRPLHRPLSGDIDVVLLPAGATDCSVVAVQRVESELERRGIVVRQTTEKHAAFDFEGVHFESHRTLLSAEADIAVARAEEMVKMLAREEGLRPLSVAGKTFPNVCVLPPKANALFLLRHLAMHFATHRGMLVRSVVDWGCFLRGNADALAADEPGKMKASSAIFICGLDKVAAIFSNVADRFVPGCAEAAVGILPIPKRSGCYADAAQRTYESLFEEHPELPALQGGAMWLPSRVRRLRMKAGRLMGTRWKYEYLPEKWGRGVWRR